MPPLDESYFVWLCTQVGVVDHRQKKRSHWRLMRQLYSTEFIWVLANDKNRADDGKEFRRFFLQDTGLFVHDDSWMHEPCSFLEMLVALSLRLEYLSETNMTNWFWFLLDTLGLMVYSDAYDDFENDVNEIIDRVIWRTYEPDGSGGLFPLQNPKEDQRDVEIWYQLNAYLIETT